MPSRRSEVRSQKSDDLGPRHHTNSSPPSVSAPSAPPTLRLSRKPRQYGAVPTRLGRRTYRHVVRRNSTTVTERAAAQELLTVLAHDLRNHLTPLQGRLDLIRRRAMREGRGEYLRDSEHAVRTVDRLRRLIDDLLA